jgi:hypothetical protein
MIYLSAKVQDFGNKEQSMASLFNLIGSKFAQIPKENHETELLGYIFTEHLKSDDS